MISLCLLKKNTKLFLMHFLLSLIIFFLSTHAFSLKKKKKIKTRKARQTSFPKRQRKNPHEPENKGEKDDLITQERPKSDKEPDWLNVLQTPKKVA